VKPGTLPEFPRRTAILGSTGSIGEKALAVAARHPHRFRLMSLATGRSGARLAEQELRPAGSGAADGASGLFLAEAFRRDRSRWPAWPPILKSIWW
jgi:hypothetical protein